MLKRLIIAAGHGGGDSGATGQGTTEAAECIDIVNRTADKLRRNGGCEVVVVPHELGLVDTINWINARYGNLEDGYALEVHKNATVNAHGIEGWFFGGDTDSASYMNTIASTVAAFVGLSYRGNFPDTSNRWGRLGFVRDTNPWAGLLECGFVSDGGDPVGAAANDRYAEGIRRGVLRLFGVALNDPAPAPVPNPTPAPTPAPDVPKFRVYDHDGKQIGAYNTESGAWNKYQTGGSKIVDTATGADVTAAFVLKYRPTPPQPVPNTDPHPEYDPTKDNQQDARLSALEALVKKITDFLSNLFKGFS